MADMMKNMSVSRRQRSVTTSSIAGDPPSIFDVESSTRDLSCLNISPAPPPPFMSTPRTPPPERRGRGPVSYLWHAWKHSKSQASALLDEEKEAAGEAATACPTLGHSHNRLAPASADGVYTLEDSQRRRRWRRLQPQKKPSRCDSDSRRRRGLWGARLRSNWCRVSLVFIVGALAFDLYLACLESRAGTPWARKGRLFSFIPSSFWANPLTFWTKQDSRDALFPDFPSNNDQLGSRSPHGVHIDDEHKGYTRRPTWDRGAKKGNGPPLTAIGSLQTDAEGESRPIGNDIEIKPHERQGATAAGAAGVAAADVGTRVDEMVTAQKFWEAPTKPQPPQHDPFHGQRVAVVVPYVGRDLPVWWDAFAEQARLNDGLIDWIIFCDQVSYPCCAIVDSLSKPSRENLPPLAC